MPSLTTPSPFRFQTTSSAAQPHRNHENLAWTAFPAKRAPAEQPPIFAQLTSERYIPLKEHGSQRFKRLGFGRGQNGDGSAAVGGTLARRLVGGSKVVVKRDDPGRGGKIAMGVRNKDEETLELHDDAGTTVVVRHQHFNNIPASASAQRNVEDDINSPRRKRHRLELRTDIPPPTPQTPTHARIRPQSQQTPRFHAAPTFTLTPTTFSFPAHPIRILRQPSPTFQTHPTASSTTTTTTQPPQERHRRFLLPASVASAEDPRAKEPPILLPDAFSPNRRKERFLPGGWAAQARSWIVDISVAGASGRGAHGADEETRARLPARLGATTSLRVMAVEGGGAVARVKDAGGGMLLVRAEALSRGRAHDRWWGDAVAASRSDGDEGQSASYHLVLVGQPVATATASSGGPRWAPHGADAPNGQIFELAYGASVRIDGPAWEFVLPMGTMEQLRGAGDGARNWVVCPVWSLA